MVRLFYPLQVHFKLHKIVNITKVYFLQNDKKEKEEENKWETFSSINIPNEQ